MQQTALEVPVIPEISDANLEKWAPRVLPVISGFWGQFYLAEPPLRRCNPRAISFLGAIPVGPRVFPGRVIAEINTFHSDGLMGFAPTQAEVLARINAPLLPRVSFFLVGDPYRRVEAANGKIIRVARTTLFGPSQVEALGNF